MNRALVDEFRWLLRQSAAKLIQETVVALDEQESVITIAKRLRKSVQPTRAAMIMEQAQLRIRGRKKFAFADQMLFTRRGLEQSSGSDIANYKASHFAAKDSVADICCGVGGDLVSLALRPGVDASIANGHESESKTASTVGIDEDEVTALFAAKNLEVMVAAHQMESKFPHRKQWVQRLEFEKTNLESFDAIHVDPDRRAKRKTVRGDQFRPNLDQVYAAAGPPQSLCVKVAPATPLGQYVPETLLREWVGDRRECKQQLLWSGDWGESMTNQMGFRKATSVDDGKVFSFAATESDCQNQRCGIVKSLPEYLYEPHPTVLAADLTSCLANEFDACRATSHIPYLFSDRLIEHGLLSSFQILDVVPMKPKAIMASLKSHDMGVVECKRRGIDKVTASRFANLKGPGDLPGVLILTCVGTKEKRVAMIAQRC